MTLSDREKWQQFYAIQDMAQDVNNVLDYAATATGSLANIEGALADIDDALDGIRTDANDRFEFFLFWDSLTKAEKKAFLAFREQERERLRREAKRLEELQKQQWAERLAAQHAEEAIREKEAAIEYSRKLAAQKTVGTPEWHQLQEFEKLARIAKNRDDAWVELRRNDKILIATRRLAHLLDQLIVVIPILAFICFAVFYIYPSTVDFVGFTVVAIISLFFAIPLAVGWYSMVGSKPKKMYINKAFERFRAVHPEHKPFTHFEKFDEYPELFKNFKS